MALVFRFFRNTVAPATGAEFASTTAPITTRWPRFCACAVPGPIRPPAEPIAPAARTANTTPAAIPALLTLTLPPRPLQSAHHRRKADPRPPAPTPAVLRRPPRTPFRIRHKRPRRLLPLLQSQYQDHSRTQGSWSWHSPLDQGMSHFRIMAPCGTTSLSLGRTRPQVKRRESQLWPDLPCAENSPGADRK